MKDKKLMQKARNIFTNLKTYPNSILFSEVKIDEQLLKKFKKSKYIKDSLFLKLIFLADNRPENQEKMPTRADSIKKQEIDRSTLYSFDARIQLVHADVRNLEFLGSSATIPRYVLLTGDLYRSKVYVYPMHSRKQILQKIALFYNEIKNKRKNKLMRLQETMYFKK